MGQDKEKFLTRDMRKGLVGLVEYKGIEKVSIHFAEWWNGEGLDFTFLDEKGVDEKRLSLHGEEMKVLAAVMVKSGYIDIDEVKELAESIKSAD